MLTVGSSHVEPLKYLFIRRIRVAGADVMIEWLRDVMEGAATAHYAHGAEISLLTTMKLGQHFQAGRATQWP